MDAAQAPRCLLRGLDELKDPRVDRTQHHSLHDILIITILAVIRGADGFARIALFGRSKIKWLRTFLALPSGIPSHDTFGRVHPTTASLLDMMTAMSDALSMPIIDTPNGPLTRTRLAPTHVQSCGQGAWFIAFERAAFGTVELVLNGEHDGQTIEVHLGEMLGEPNRIERQPPGTIRYLRTSLVLRRGRHRYRVVIPPDHRNTGPRAIAMPDEIGQVMPFRYCEVHGTCGPMTNADAAQIMVHAPFDDQATKFVCNDDVLNRVWDLCRYTIKATTFCGLYVDGDRERIPYEADAYLNQLSHYCVDREYEMARRTFRHLIAYPTWPTEWALHMPMMAWADYLYSGDDTLITEYFDELNTRALTALAREDGLISTQTDKVTEELVRAMRLDKPPRDLVDWPPANFTQGKFGERDGYDMVAINTVVNAFHYHALNLMAEIARHLGCSTDATDFARRAALVRQSINQKLFDTQRGIYVDGEGSAHASLHANMFALAFGVVPGDRRPGVVDFIKSRGMACSVYGAQYLLEALYLAGEADYALSLMTARHDRSWWNMLAVGSTMTLEAWDWKYKNNLDWNHAWGAAPANIIPRFLMGVRPGLPGFERIIIQPQPGTLAHALLKMPTCRGPVCVRIASEPGRRFELDVELPAGVEPDIRLPSIIANDAKVTVNGKPHHASIAAAE